MIVAISEETAIPAGRTEIALTPSASDGCRASPQSRQSRRSCFVLVSHMTKGRSANVKHRVSGSVAYVGGCRANFLFVPDPRDPACRRVLVLDNGANAAPLAPILADTIEDQGGRGPQVVWSDEPATVMVERALRPALAKHARDDEHEIGDCAEWLRETLAGGRVPAAELRHACQEAGFAWSILHRVRSRIGAGTRREGFGPGSQSYWYLSDAIKHGSIEGIDLTPAPSI